MLRQRWVLPHCGCLGPWNRSGSVSRAGVVVVAPGLRPRGCLQHVPRALVGVADPGWAVPPLEQLTVSLSLPQTLRDIVIGVLHQLKSQLY